VVAALTLWLVLLVAAPRQKLASIQDVNQLIFALLLLPLATAATALGLCRFRIVRWACTLIAMWLMLSPLLLPGPFSNTALFGGLATFAAAAWAARED